MTYYFKNPFAKNGEVTQIPMNSQGDGNVSYEEGWVEGYELDATSDPDDARNLSRTNFNGLFFNITNAIRELQEKGVKYFITEEENDGEPFAYDLGGVCGYTDPTTGDYGVYYSLRSNNTTKPSENGVTTKFWRRVFQSDIDSIKSNRLYSTILNYTTAPVCTKNPNGYTFTIYENTKFLFSNGIEDDGTLKNSIVQFTNTVSRTVTEGGRYIFFGTSNEDILVVKASQFTFFTNEDDAITELNAISEEDCYYFNNSENRWKIRRANTNRFVDSDIMLALAGSVDIVDGEVHDGEFGISKPLRFLSEFEVEKKLEKKQNLLIPGRHLSLEKVSTSQDLLKVDLLSDTTHFCVNSCNLNDQGTIDLLWIETKLVPVVEYEQIDVEYKVSKKVTNNKISSFGSNGSISSGKTAVNTTHAFGTNSSYYTYFSSSSYQNNPKTTYLQFSFTTSPRIDGNAVLSFSYNFPSGCCDYGYNHRSRSLRVYVIFTDGTSYCCHSSSTYTSNGSGWINKSISIPSTYNNKYISSIKFDITMDVYCNYSRNSNHLQITNVQLRMDETIWETRIRQETIEKWHDEWRGKSNKVYFKTGSNYYDLLSDPENATPMFDLSTAKITSTISEFNEMWGSPNIIVKFNDWWTEFKTEYEFLETPAETSNAKLLFRYNDIDAEGLLNNLTITLTYWGGATRVLCDKITLLKTQDVLLDIPDGKYIQKVTITADEMDNLGGSSLGMVNMYNNVASGLEFNQYPAIYASSADGNKYFMQNNVPVLFVEHSGYVMLSESGAYILPGTNVIRRQKFMPTIEDEPKLTDGDVWLDISSEPLRAYQYYNGTWLIFNDVPVGYVTAEYLDPIAEVLKASETITDASVNAETFLTKKTADGIYEFTYTDSHWYLGEDQVNIAQYGITITGTPTEGDTLQVTFTIGEPTVTSVEQYPINQNGYDVNVYTETTNQLRGKDGRDGQDGKDGKDGKNGRDGAQGPAGRGVPMGGRVGQVVAKATNLDYDTTWTDCLNVETLNGGTTGQTLIKNSDTDLDFSWGTLEALPDGGNTGQALVKASDSDYDAEWATIIPSGGVAGNTLIKNSSTDGDFDWGKLETLPEGGAAGYALVKNSGTDYDVKWEDLRLPTGGNTGEVLSKSSNNNYDAEWTTAHYIPSGGTTGQALAKTENSDYSAQWTTIVPNGGTKDQVLIKNSNSDLDTKWETVVGIPTGGNVGQALVKVNGDDYNVQWTNVIPNGGTIRQVLTKNSNNDRDISWTTVIPDGGATGQTLVKHSNDDGDVEWADGVPYGGLPGQVLTKKDGHNQGCEWRYLSNETGSAVANLNFKSDIYFYAHVNGFVGIWLEQFKDFDGVETEYVETVMENYNIGHGSVKNASLEDDLVFDLKEIQFGERSHLIHFKSEHTDTVTFSYSIDGGENFNTLTEDENISCFSYSLIIRVTIEPEAELKNMALLIK